ncbi:unnamed protein product [Auanema sp. JU1783]|nr:unnamed protein product [Auanema sp. JU1783]
MSALRPNQVDFDKVWSELRSSVVDIINLNPIPRLTWDYKFSDVYNICVAIPDPLSDKLYRALSECLEEHVSQQYQAISKVHYVDLLSVYDKMWNTFFQGTMVLHNLFRYLNIHFVNKKKDLDPEIVNQYAGYLAKPNLKEVGCLSLEVWKTKLIQEILKKLINLLLTAIAEDRAGNPPSNKSVIRGVIMSFVQVEQYNFEKDSLHAMNKNSTVYHEFYENEFEIPFLNSTEEYYTLYAQKLLADMSCSQYMEAVINAIEAERRRAAQYVCPSTVEKVIKVCQNVMISIHKEKLNGVCSDLIRNEERKDLQNMYRLLKPIPSGLTVMIKEFEDYVRQKGHEALAMQNMDPITAPQQFVENILMVYDKFSEMKSTVFMDDGDFAQALDKALQTVVNMRNPTVPSKSSERLARYSDSLLRKNNKNISENELDEKLSRTIIIFRYIEDKDIFQKYYSKMLSVRLIHNLSVSMEAEELMINKLKQACGYEFTSKLSRMFTDVNLCPELTAEFKQYLNEKERSHHVDMQPMVLTAGSWPLSAPNAGGTGSPATNVESISFIIPPTLKNQVEYFEEFYGKKHSGRKLSWLYHSSHGELKTSYLQKVYLIQMGAFQMAALLVFNYQESMTVESLGAEIGLTGELLQKIIRTLTDSQMLLLTEKEDFNSSVLSLNFKMNAKRSRFKLPSVQSSKQIEKEVDTTQNTVAQDRKYYVECAVVRIMKTRKVLKHNVLISEVMDQIKGRFKPDVSLVKKCIEDLIDKLYLQRTDQNDEYQYLA